MAAGSGGAETYVHNGKSVVLSAGIIPNSDGSVIVAARVYICVAVPPKTLVFLVCAGAAPHYPPAVPFAVPPVKKRVARGLVECVLRLGIGRLGGIYGYLAGFFAQKLRECDFNRSFSVFEEKSGANVEGFTGLRGAKLTVRGGFIGGGVQHDHCGGKRFLALNGFLGNAPNIGGVLLAVVGEAEGNYKGVLSVRILHNFRTEVVKLDFSELYVGAAFVLAAYVYAALYLVKHAAGGKGENERRTKKYREQAADNFIFVVHNNVLRSFLCSKGRA